MSLSSIRDLRVDEPLEQNANYVFDDVDRQYIDDQVRGCQGHLVQSLLSGLTATWVHLSATSPALAPGDCVCLTGERGDIAVVAKALGLVLEVAGAVFGVALLPAAPGGMALVAIGGAVPPTITRLEVVQVALPVQCDPQTARCARFMTFGALSYPVGIAEPRGMLKLTPLPVIGKLGAGAGGGLVGGDVDGNVPGNLLVTGLQGRKVAVTFPNVGETLQWNGQAWTPTPPPAAIAWADDLGGSSNTSQKVVRISGDSTGTARLAARVQGVDGDPLRFGRTSVVVAGGAPVVTLLPSQVTTQVLELTGALTQNTGVVLPAVDGYAKLVINKTTGNFSLGVRTPAGQGVRLPRGRAEWVYCNGTDLLANGPGLRIVDVRATTLTASETFQISSTWLDSATLRVSVPNVELGDVMLFDASLFAQMLASGAEASMRFILRVAGSSDVSLDETLTNFMGQGSRVAFCSRLTAAAAAAHELVLQLAPFNGPIGLSRGACVRVTLLRP